MVRLNARAEHELPAGAAVHVTSVLSPSAVTVSPLYGDLPSADPPPAPTT